MKIVEQLIQIEQVPIEMKIKVTPSKLEAVRGTANLEIDRHEGGLRIKSQPIRLRLDTFEARDSIRPASDESSIRAYAQQGRQSAYEATASFAQQGELMLKAHLDQDVIAQMASKALQDDRSGDVGIEFLPGTAPKIDWDPGQMEISFEMDKLNFDWRISKNHFEFTPGDIEISVTQKPDLVIKYVGGPLYVPPSSDPDYEPVDVRT